ncbi:MAG: metallophosphoesterase, partial [Lachnospiraceae bacterium]|nr:metallophosphoesterase [Lachnospiraceae bacterium]
MRLILIILTILIVFFGTVIIYDTHRFVVERFCFKSDKVKGRLRIVFLSDLHNKRFGTDNSKLIDAVMKENPDIV